MMWWWLVTGVDRHKFFTHHSDRIHFQSACLWDICHTQRSLLMGAENVPWHTSHNADQLSTPQSVYNDIGQSCCHSHQQSHSPCSPPHNHMLQTHHHHHQQLTYCNPNPLIMSTAIINTDISLATHRWQTTTLPSHWLLSDSCYLTQQSQYNVRLSGPMPFVLAISIQDFRDFIFCPATFLSKIASRYAWYEVPIVRSAMRYWVWLGRMKTDVWSTSTAVHQQYTTNDVGPSLPTSHQHHTETFQQRTALTAGNSTTTTLGRRAMTAVFVVNYQCWKSSNYRQPHTTKLPYHKKLFIALQIARYRVHRVYKYKCIKTLLF